MIALVLLGLRVNNKLLTQETKSKDNFFVCAHFSEKELSFYFSPLSCI